MIRNSEVWVPKNKISLGKLITKIQKDIDNKYSDYEDLLKRKREEEAQL